MDDLIEYLMNITEDFDFKKLIFPTIMILIYVAGFVYLITIIKNIDNRKPIITNRVVEREEEIKVEDIYVDVKGSVKKPGVYKLKNDSRVIDAVNEAGGLSESANTRYINLSKKLEDGDVVMVYSSKEIKEAQKENTVYIETPCVCEQVKNDACITENKNTSKTDKTSTINKTNKVNINTAQIEELKTLSGIGDAKANAIIEYRNTNGNFKSIEDIKNVSGISETVYSKIKENITI